jgi:hypothetical protein
MTTQDELVVRAAARNNARWCATMGRAHGVSGELGERAWTAPVRTPVFYPDAVTLVPGVDPTEVLARIDTATPGASVKDSFADLELAEHGFDVLFEAQWIHRPPGAPAIASDLVWTVVDTPDQLRAWALAWDDGRGDADLFRPALLDDPSTLVLALRSAAGRLVAGAIACRSEEVVGISNLFALEGDPDAAWAGVLEAVAALFPALPVVDYAYGDDLAAAVRHGFEPVGPLRVWMHA